MQPSHASNLTLHDVSGLRCYTCDNVGSGDACIDNPETIVGGANTCQEPNDEFCYTSRLEEPADDGIGTSKFDHQASSYWNI